MYIRCIRILLLSAVATAGSVGVCLHGAWAEINTAAIGPADPMLPDGHRLVAWLDCGSETQTSPQSTPVISLLAGKSHIFPGIAGPLATAAYDAERVVYEVTGLNPDRAYVLGFTWWDADEQGRVQSVAFNRETESHGWNEVLPPVRASAFNANTATWARVHLPLSASYEQVETLQVAFVSEAGPNAVINELWLLERDDTSKSKRVAIITGDDYAGHDWRATAAALATLLRQEQHLEVSISESPALYGSPLLDHYDATVLHFKNYADRLPLSEQIQKGLKRHVASGGGLMITHFGCGAFQEWDEFVQVAGRIWNPALRAHDPHGAFLVQMTDVEHPITQGMEDFETTDELYTCLDGDASITILCEAVSAVDNVVYPIAFVVEDVSGPVFHCVLGHDVQAYQSPGVRELFRRGIIWVTQ